jgi:hypothetical protein
MLAPLQFFPIQTGSNQLAATGLFPGATTPGSAIVVPVAVLTSMSAPGLLIFDSFRNAYSHAGSVQITNLLALHFFCAVNIAAGPGHQLWVLSSSPGFITAIPVEVSGPSTPDGFASGSSQSATPDSGACAVNAAGDLLFSAIVHSANGSPSLTPAAGWTPLLVLPESQTHQPLGLAYRNSDVAVDGQWTVGASVPWGCATMSLRVPAGNPPAPPLTEEQKQTALLNRIASALKA